jgi:hypothetical protein
MIAPEVARLAQQYQDVIFIKVDVDQLQVLNTPRSFPSSETFALVALVYLPNSKPHSDNVHKTFARLCFVFAVFEISGSHYLISKHLIGIFHCCARTAVFGVFSRPLIV